VKLLRTKQAKKCAQMREQKNSVAGTDQGSHLKPREPRKSRTKLPSEEQLSVSAPFPQKESSQQNISISGRKLTCCFGELLPSLYKAQ
jgi:hypothetical protein